MARGLPFLLSRVERDNWSCAHKKGIGMVRWALVEVEDAVEEHLYDRIGECRVSGDVTEEKGMRMQRGTKSLRVVRSLELNKASLAATLRDRRSGVAGRTRTIRG